MNATLTYDILDDLEPLHTDAKQTVLDDISEESPYSELTPAEWYERAEEMGCNVIFTFNMDYDVDYQTGLDYENFADRLNEIAQRYFGDECLKVQAVYSQISDDRLERSMLREDIPIEPLSLTRQYMKDNINYVMNHMGRLIFKLAVRIPSDCSCEWDDIIKGVIDDKSQPFYKKAERIVARFLNFLATVQSIKNHYPYMHTNFYYPKKLFFGKETLDNSVSVLLWHNKIRGIQLKEGDVMNIIRFLKNFYTNLRDNRIDEWLIEHATLKWINKYVRTNV